MFEVFWDRKFEKQLKRLPKHVRAKFYFWVSSIKMIGFYKLRESHGFHDEPLQGELRGKRSIRLNRSYRVVYIQTSQTSIQILSASKHEY